MRLGLAQLNTIVGDLQGNRERILAAYRQLVARGAELVVFPELAVCGYPPRDLLLKRHFVSDTADTLAAIAAGTGTVPALVGTVTVNSDEHGRGCYNSAAFCVNGRVAHLAHKCLLPTTDVFDEDRYFEPAASPLVIEHAGRHIGVTICEDIWMQPYLNRRRLYHGLDPVTQLAAQKCDLLINLSASPWHQGKTADRQACVTQAARTLGCPAVYVNAVGGNDELIFDGRSLVADAHGAVLHGLPSFQESFIVVETDVPVPSLDRTFVRDGMDDLFAALVLGLRDYARKSGFTRALVALSGGIDSALVAVIAAEALGPENVTGVSLPSAISSQHSRDDARVLAANMGIRFESIAIAPAVAACETALAPLLTGRARDVTEENIQARVRAVLMMGLANKSGALLLTTGNKSESAVGYCTLYGDMAGGLAVIADVFKTQVYALSRWINRAREIIPANTILKPPSAELRPNQTDQDSLPPYDQLDAILQGAVEEGLARRDLVARGFPAAVVDDVFRKIDRSEFKRKQAAPVLKLTPLAFGVGRRMPIVQKYPN